VIGKAITRLFEKYFTIEFMGVLAALSFVMFINRIVDIYSILRDDF